MNDSHVDQTKLNGGIA